ncbi:Ig domain-containing protein, partial [Nocardioides sp. GCM10030258]|uniref:Ig domain-containing protein n=1 Tax=unclassified Nocardioides TaxID=2615069 RepID=UPI003620E0AB
ATCETAAFAIGSHDVVASYSGDAVLAPAEFGTTYAVAHKPLHITTTSLPGAKAGAPYSAQLTAEDGLGPYTWHLTAGSLPPGVTLSLAGAISGTPTGVGSGNPVTFEVRDAQDVPFTDSLALTLGVQADTVRPIATIRVPTGAAAYRVGSWRTLTGKATDSGVGVKNVRVRVIEKRGTAWYGYRADTGRWVKRSTAARAWNAATARTVSVTNGVWTSRVAGLTKGRIAVRLRAIDHAGNRSETVRTVHVLNRR